MRKCGFDKHAWTYVIKYEPNYFGKRGFTSPRSLGRETKVINVGELEDLASKLLATNQLNKEGGKVLLDLESLGYTKLLAKGKISKPLTVKVASCSKRAADKVREAGGQVILTSTEKPIS